MLQNVREFFISRLLSFIFHIFEYYFYLDYHKNGKNEDFKFMLEKNLIVLSDLRLNENNIFILGKSIRLSEFSKNGMQQFTFDCNFLVILILYYSKEKKVPVNFHSNKILLTIK